MRLLTWFLVVLFLGVIPISLIAAEEDTNIVAAAQADEGADWESVFTETNEIPFHINLYVKDGFYYEVVESGDYDGLFYTSIFSEKRRLTGRLGVKVHADAALYDESGNLPDVDNSLAIRRFRINTYGRAFFLSPLTFGLEFGVSDGKFFFNDGYVWFHDVSYVSGVKVGIFTAPLSLEQMQSSSTGTMMERAASVTAFAPADKLGLQLGGPVLNKRGSLVGGIFSDVVNTENADAEQGATRLIGRATWLLRDNQTEESDRLIHLGLSSSFLSAAGDGVEYRSRPESYLAPYLIDTGKLQGDRAYLFGFESAYQKGSLLLQSEFFHVNADDLNSDLHRFWGAYVNGSLMLTGETRPYNRDAGHFSGIKPKQKFSFKNRTWGALEWIARLSYTDLSDGSIQGGRMGILSTGFNVYLKPRNRLMFNVGAGDVRNTVNDGAIYYAQTRLQIEL